MSRREKIEAMLADAPEDEFLRYTLALELDKEQQHDRSLELLRQLMAPPTHHVPSYFMAGQQLTRLGRIEDAREVLRDGIEHARQQGNSHAAAEMSEFLTTLGSLG